VPQIAGNSNSNNKKRLTNNITDGRQHLPALPCPAVMLLPLPFAFAFPFALPYRAVLRVIQTSIRAVPLEKTPKLCTVLQLLCLCKVVHDADDLG